MSIMSYFNVTAERTKRLVTAGKCTAIFQKRMFKMNQSAWRGKLTAMWTMRGQVAHEQRQAEADAKTKNSAKKLDV